MPDLLEPPPAIDFDTAIAEQVVHDGAAQSGQDPKKAVENFQKSKAPVEKPKVEEPVLPKVDEPNKKPEDKTAPDKKEKTDPLGKIETIAPTDEEKKKKEQSRWMELKAAEKERDELRQWRAEQEKKLKELEAKAWKDEDRARYDELQKKERAWEVESTPEWKQQIEVPFQQRETYVNEAAKHFGIDPESLWGALDETHPFTRSEKIEELISKANEARLEKDAKPIPANFGAALTKVGDELQIIYHEMAKKRAAALELGGSLEAQKAQMTEKQQAEQKEQYHQQYTDVKGELEKKLPALFSRKDLMIDGVPLTQAVEEAIPSEDARGKAYQALAGEILPFITHHLKSVEAELATLKKEVADRAAANPNMQQTTVKIPDKEKPEFASLDEAIAAQRRVAPGTLGM